MLSRKADRQTGRQADRQTGRQADSRQADRQTGRQTDRQTLSVRQSISHTMRQKIRWKDSQTPEQLDRTKKKGQSDGQTSS